MKGKLQICHIVPSNFGGGVEAAARSFMHFSCDKFIFNVYFMKIDRKQNSFISNIKSLEYLFKKKPDIILTSLWKSNLLALTYKLFNKKTKLILFFHAPKNIHLVDEIFTNLTAIFSYEIWSDSKTTMIERINNLFFFKTYANIVKTNKKKRVISFVKDKITPIPFHSCENKFIYWGRLCPNKNIDKAIKLFSKIKRLDFNSSFIIIGPDNGVQKMLFEMIKNMGLKDNVFIFDFMEFKEIKKYSENATFFIQLSSFEGMAMSVAESMQLGLIPVVTNVGEIKNYCKDMNNSLIYHDNDDDVIKNIFELIGSEESYKKIRRNSIKTWTNSSTYRDDIINNFNEISNYFI